MDCLMICWNYELVLALLERISVQYTQSELFRITFATSKFPVNLTCIGFNVF